jgi:hypothetical protein
MLRTSVFELYRRDCSNIAFGIYRYPYDANLRHRHFFFFFFFIFFFDATSQTSP